MNKQGWGYKDTAIQLDYDAKICSVSGISFTINMSIGNKYELCGKKLPLLHKWGSENAGIDFNYRAPKQNDMNIHAPIINHQFLEEVGESGFDRRSFLKWERINHSHGCTLEEVFILRHGTFKRCVDVIIYPESNE